MSQEPSSNANPCVSVPFLVEEWDEKASLSPHHLSYIISVLLPKRLVALKRDFNIESQLKSFCEKKHITNAVHVGSSSEGLNIPISMTIELNSQLGTNADADVLFVEEDFQIPVKNPIQDSDIQVTLESDEVHPGYTRVRLHSDTKYQRETITLNDKRYLSGQGIQKRMQKKVISSSPKDDETLIFIHGPAVSVEYSTALNAENIQTRGLRIALDMVFAVQVNQWPQEAKEWIERSKQGQWLENELIESIVSEGCHVVPVAHKHSLHPDVEWRISFAATEKQIAKSAVTDAQRQCYIYLKILRNLCLKDLEVLSSYCLKTVFFYACETVEKSCWENHKGQCLLYLIDCLTACVKRRNIPSFFIPKNNLVDHVPEEKWQEVEDRLLNIRKDPISPILKFTDTSFIGFIDIPFVFRQNIAYVLEDMEKFKVHRDIRKSAFDAFFTSSFRMALILLDRGKPKDAVQILMDSYPTINKYLGPMPLICYLNEASVLIQDSRLFLLLLQELFNMTEQYPEFKQFKGNLACAYNAASHTYPEQSSERSEYLQKAEKMVQEEIEAQDLISFATHITYAIILITQRRYKEAIEILEVVVNAAEERTKEEIESEITEFGFSEQICVDKDLQLEISTHMKIAGPSLIFAYYFLVKCLLEQENEVTRLKTYFDKYQKACELCEDVTGYKLLGYSYSQVGETQKAKEAFMAALQKMPGNKLLIANVEKCTDA